MEKKDLITKAIQLCLIDENDKLIELNFDFSKVFVLEIQNITTTIGHTAKGKYLKFLHCGFLNLQFYLDKISTDDLEMISQYDILSITLELNNKTTESYNVPWELWKKRNALQIIERKDNILKISIG